MKLDANLPCLDDDFTAPIVLKHPSYTRRGGEKYDMKSIKTISLAAVGYLFATQPAFAGVVVPEIDGGGAVIAIGLVAGLVALVRERFFRK